MTPAFVRTPERRWMLWVWAGLFLVLALSAWAVHRQSPSDNWSWPVPLWYVFVWMPIYWFSQPFCVASHGVLAVINSSRSLRRHVPLAAVTAQRDKRRWRLRWTEGHRRREVILPDAPAMADLVQYFPASQTGPLTEKDAARLLTVVPHDLRDGWMLWATLAFTLTGTILATLLTQPLFLLSLLAMPLMVALTRTRYLALTPDALWIVEADQAPIRLDRDTITLDPRRTRPVIHTQHPAYPRLSISRISDAELIRRLQYGDRPPAGRDPKPM